MNISLNDSDFEDGINLKKILMKVLDKTKNTILYVECDTTNESCWIGTSIHITTFDEIVEMILVANDECNICYTGQTNDIICISFRDKDFENIQYRYDIFHTNKKQYDELLTKLNYTGNNKL